MNGYNLSMKLVALLAGLASLATAQDFDILIRGGRIVDGTGNPSFVGDVGIRDGKVAALGRLTGKSAKETIEAAGLIVAPGFIDIHNHSDNTLLVDGNAESMIRQGVTSMIFGEGGSAAPLKPGAGEWTDFKGYFAKLLQKGISTNIGTYVGSSQIWTYVHGPNAGPASAAELTEMQRLVREAMEQGALGVASSLSGPPGSWIDKATLIAMCKAAAPYGGIYSTHMRTEGHGVFESVAEAIDIGRQSGVPVDIIHIKIAEHALWGKMPELIGTIQQARANGQLVEANVYPYRAGQNNLSSIIPPWAHEGGTDALLARLKDPKLRLRLESEIEHGIPGSNWYNHYTATGSWEGMLLVSLSNPEYKKYEGKRMNEVIRMMGVKPIDALFEILQANRGSIPTIYFHHNEEDMRYALKQPFVSIGSDGTAVSTTGPLSAGHPHPRYYGTFPRVLGRYVRDEKVITMEEAIRKMTSANTAKIHIYDRGLLRPGMWADVTVFDPAKVIDKSTFEQPHQYAEGIEHVFVNGKLVLSKGKHSGARPGVILMGQGVPPARPERAAAEWIIRLGGGLRVDARAPMIRELAALPKGDFRIVAVDMVGTTMDPLDMKNLGALQDLEELLLPGTIFNPGAGSRLDANDGFAGLANLHNLKKLYFSLHFLESINVQDKGLALLKDLTQIEEMRLTMTRIKGPSLAPFVNLRDLDLNDTPFNDDGMKSLAGMKHLTRLSLRDTYVGDEGLKQIAGLTELVALDLSGTKVTDAGLGQLKGLRKLQKLNLLGTKATDEGLASLAAMTDLQELNLYRTEITNSGLSKLQGLKKMAALDLRYTGVSRGGIEAFRAAVPECKIEFQDSAAQAADAALRKSKPKTRDAAGVTAWVTSMGGKVTGGSEVTLARTPVTDAQLEFLALLPGLEKLDLQATDLGQAGLAAVAKLTRLKELNLSNTTISDPALVGLQKLTGLQVLLLNNVPVQGLHLGSFPALRRVALAGSRLNDAGLKSLAGCTKLEALEMNYTDISNGGLAELKALTSLRKLDLTSTDIDDAGLEYLKPLTSLKELMLNFTRITDKGLDSLVPLVGLERLEVARTRVTDEGLKPLAKLTALRQVNLDYTKVSEKGLAGLSPNLTYLRLDSATISDASIETLRGKAQLQYLNLYHTLVTEKGFALLKAALPKCEIVFDRDSAQPTRRGS
jgi:N-acyl-D-aspartate/D-glutamate deacylase/Leucine-rich repeat (LRR) protein